jgi:small-conductance mechanosensitive channel
MASGADPNPTSAATAGAGTDAGPRRRREELELLKLEAEVAKLQLEGRELSRPQLRRMPVVISSVTAIVAVFGAGLQFWISRHEYQLAELERQRAALAEQAAALQAERAAFDEQRAELETRRAEQKQALAQEQATATEARIAQTQQQLDATSEDLDDALQAVQAIVPATPKQTGQVEAAQKAIRRATMNAPTRTRGNELQIARDIEEAVQSGDYSGAAAKFEALRGSHFSGVGYSAYPDVALALDRTGDPDRSLQALESLQEQLREDAAKGSGYLAPGRPARAWVKTELAEMAKEATDPRVKAKAESLATAP